MIFRESRVDRGRVRDLAAKKFELVRAGDHRARIESKILAMGGEYDDAVSAVAPDAPDYATACELVLRELSTLLP
jgi:hypothetical protein